MWTTAPPSRYTSACRVLTHKISLQHPNNHTRKALLLCLFYRGGGLNWLRDPLTQLMPMESKLEPRTPASLCWVFLLYYMKWCKIWIKRSSTFICNSGIGPAETSQLLIYLQSILSSPNSFAVPGEGVWWKESNWILIKCEAQTQGNVGNNSSHCTYPGALQWWWQMHSGTWMINTIPPRVRISWGKYRYGWLGRGRTHYVHKLCW